MADDLPNGVRPTGGEDDVAKKLSDLLSALGNLQECLSELHATMTDGFATNTNLFRQECQEANLTFGMLCKGVHVLEGSRRKRSSD